MEKRIPTRMCVACRERKDKKDLIKVVKTPDGFVVDGDNKTFGRGAYVCKKEDCIKIAVKKRAFDRSFKEKLPEEVYAKLKEININD